MPIVVRRSPWTRSRLSTLGVTRRKAEPSASLQAPVRASAAPPAAGSGAAWPARPSIRTSSVPTHYAANLMSATPRAAGWVKTLLYSVYDQPEAASMQLSIN